MATSKLAELQKWFPKLTKENCREMSTGANPRYNCIAHAAGSNDLIWWPVNGGYWPAECKLRTETVEAFVEMFGLRGYEECDDGAFEPGYEKVAIYANGDGPQHAAHQPPGRRGWWTSKVGRYTIIAHKTLEAIECDDYGVAVKYMRRAISRKARRKAKVARRKK